MFRVSGLGLRVYRLGALMEAPDGSDEDSLPVSMGIVWVRPYSETVGF